MSHDRIPRYTARKGPQNYVLRRLTHHRPICDMYKSAKYASSQANRSTSSRQVSTAGGARCAWFFPIGVRHLSSGVRPRPRRGASPSAHLLGTRYAHPPCDRLGSAAILFVAAVLAVGLSQPGRPVADRPRPRPPRNRSTRPAGWKSTPCSDRHERRPPAHPAGRSNGGTGTAARNPREAVRHASVWLLDYPASVITPDGQSVIAAWAEPALWDILRDLQVELLHTGPIQRAWCGAPSTPRPPTAGSTPSPSTSTRRSAPRASTRNWSPSRPSAGA